MKQLLVFLLFLPGTVLAQPAIASLKLNQKLPVLGEKAYFLFPAKAANIERQADVMSAGPNAQRETRIVMDNGAQRLVFFAEELYASAGDNLATGIRANAGNEQAVKELKSADGLTAVLSTPRKTDSTHNAILINSLIVKMQNNLVFRINAYINPEAYADREAYRELSERVFSSLSKGKNQLQTTARMEVISEIEGRKLTVALPDGYALSKDAQYDFEVVRFRKIRDFFDTTWQSLDVYLGYHPSYFFRSYGFGEQQQEKASGIFLEKERSWMLFTDPKEHVCLKEQQFPMGKEEHGLIIHIGMIADQMKMIDELSRIVATIKFADQ